MISRSQIVSEFVTKIQSNGYTAISNPNVIYESDIDTPILVVVPVNDSYNPENISGKGKTMSINIEIYDKDYELAETVWSNIKDEFEGQKRLSDNYAYSEEQDTSFEFESDMQMCVMTINFTVQYNNDI